MKVLMAARNPESSSKITSTSSKRMSEVAVFLFCSSRLLDDSLPPPALLAARGVFNGSFILMESSAGFMDLFRAALEDRVNGDIIWCNVLLCNKVQFGRAVALKQPRYRVKFLMVHCSHYYGFRVDIPFASSSVHA